MQSEDGIVTGSEFDWLSLGRGLQFAHEALERDSAFQRTWVLLADIYNRIGVKILARQCLAISRRLALPGPYYPGRFHQRVERCVDPGILFDEYLEDLRPAQMPGWFIERYRDYLTDNEDYSRWRRPESGGL
jgi:hypothetical protein